MSQPYEADGADATQNLNDEFKNISNTRTGVGSHAIDTGSNVFSGVVNGATSRLFDTARKQSLTPAAPNRPSRIPVLDRTPRRQIHFSTAGSILGSQYRFFTAGRSRIPTPIRLLASKEPASTPNTSSGGKPAVRGLTSTSSAMLLGPVTKSNWLGNKTASGVKPSSVYGSWPFLKPDAIVKIPSTTKATSSNKPFGFGTGNGSSTKTSGAGIRPPNNSPEPPKSTPAVSNGPRGFSRYHENRKPTVPVFNPSDSSKTSSASSSIIPHRYGPKVVVYIPTRPTAGKDTKALRPGTKTSNLVPSTKAGHVAPPRKSLLEAVKNSATGSVIKTPPPRKSLLETVRKNFAEQDASSGPSEIPHYAQTPDPIDWRDMVDTPLPKQGCEVVAGSPVERVYTEPDVPGYDDEDNEWEDYDEPPLDLDEINRILEDLDHDELGPIDSYNSEEEESIEDMRLIRSYYDEGSEEDDEVMGEIRVMTPGNTDEYRPQAISRHVSAYRRSGDVGFLT